MSTNIDESNVFQDILDGLKKRGFAQIQEGHSPINLESRGIDRIQEAGIVLPHTSFIANLNDVLTLLVWMVPARKRICITAIWSYPNLEQFRAELKRFRKQWNTPSTRRLNPREFKLKAASLGWDGLLNNYYQLLAVLTVALPLEVFDPHGQWLQSSAVVKDLQPLTLFGYRITILSIQGENKDQRIVLADTLKMLNRLPFQPLHQETRGRKPDDDVLHRRILARSYYDEEKEANKVRQKPLTSAEVIQIVAQKLHVSAETIRSDLFRSK